MKEPGPNENRHHSQGNRWQAQWKQQCSAVGGWNRQDRRIAKRRCFRLQRTSIERTAITEIKKVCRHVSRLQGPHPGSSARMTSLSIETRTAFGNLGRGWHVVQLPHGLQDDNTRDWQGECDDYRGSSDDSSGSGYADDWDEPSLIRLGFSTQASIMLSAEWAAASRLASAKRLKRVDPTLGRDSLQDKCLRVGKKWPGAGSNRRHQDFQSCALPTELPGRLEHERRQQMTVILSDRAGWGVSQFGWPTSSLFGIVSCLASLSIAVSRKRTKPGSGLQISFFGLTIHR